MDKQINSLDHGYEPTGFKYGQFGLEPDGLTFGLNSLMVPDTEIVTDEDNLMSFVNSIKTLDEEDISVKMIELVKHLMDTVKAAGKSFDPEDMTKNLVKFFISDGLKDRHNAFVNVKGWVLKNFNKINPQVLYNHLSHTGDPDHVIGKGFAYLDAKGMNLLGDATMDTLGEGDFKNIIARKTLYKLRMGFLNTSSVRILPIKWHFGNDEKGENPSDFYFDKQELLEFSVVSIPANPRAKVKEAFQAFVKNVEDSTNFIKETKNKDIVADINKELDDDNINPDIDEKLILNNKTLLEITRARLQLIER